MKRTLLTLAVLALSASGQTIFDGQTRSLPTRVPTLPEYLKGKVQEDQAPTYIYLPARPQPSPVVNNYIYPQPAYSWYGYTVPTYYGFAPYYQVYTPILPLIIPFGR